VSEAKIRLPKDGLPPYPLAPYPIAVDRWEDPTGSLVSGRPYHGKHTGSLTTGVPKSGPPRTANLEEKRLKLVLGEISGGRYALSDLLGSGGMAEVFLAHDRILGRDLALKVLREDYAKDPGFVSRFRSEAVSAASLNHPHVVQVYDQGRSEDGRLYIAMEHVPGGNLKDLITRCGPLDPAEAALLASQVAEALGAAHERGIVHRDIKPQNVLLGEAGEAKVADFGIALAASTSTASGTNRVFGTAGYMSPEQAMGERVGPASDLYSLGVVLYEMLTGVVPFEADGPLATAMKHLTDEPIAPTERNPLVPEAMEALVMGLLAKDSEERRYGSAFELAEELRKARAELPPAFLVGAARHPETPREFASTGGGAHPNSSESEPRSRRRPVAMGLVALAALLALGTFGWGFTGYRDEGPKGVGAVVASEGGQEGGAPAAPEDPGDGREGGSGEGLGSDLPSVELAGGRYVPASSSAPPSASASASASIPASASAVSAPASASATPEAQASEPVASGPSGAAPSASASPAAPGGSSELGGQDAGTTGTSVAESAAQEQYR
jgi:eukaryotic-like serine/threonine-protein kinase